MTSFLFAGPFVAWAGARAASRARRSIRGSPAPPSPRAPCEEWNLELGVLFVGTLVVYMFWYYHGNGVTWGPRYLYATLPALLVFTGRGLIGFAECLAAATRRHGRLARLAKVVPIVTVAALVAWGTVPFLVQMRAQFFLCLRRSTAAFLQELKENGVERGTVFVERGSKMGRDALCGLLFASRFDERAPLVFVRDLAPHRNAAFLLWRPPGPAYHVRPDSAKFQWKRMRDP